MRTRLLLSALAGAVALVLGLTAFGTAGGPTDCAAEEAAFANGKPAAEIAREKIYGGCTEVENEVMAISTPNEVILARQLFGADPGIDPAAYFRNASEQARAIGEQTAQAAPEVAAAEWALDRPTTIGGRVLDLAVDPVLQDTVYTAAATGGVFVSKDKGLHWTSIWPDDLPQSIGALAIAPDATLYAGTGEAGPGGGSSTYGGAGVFRSRDRGETWEPLGLESTNRIGRIAIDPKDPQRVFVAGTGPLYTTKGGGRGLFLSEDGGDTWSKVLAGENATSGAVDVAIDPVDTNVVYAAMWDNFRERDRRLYEGVGSGLYKSTDGGRTWARIGQPFFGPRPDVGRIGVAVASDRTVYANVSGPSGVYAGFYSSKDQGLTWTTGQPPANPQTSFFVYGWWFGRIYVDPKDPQRVYQATLVMQRSTDGGRTWSSAPGGCSGICAEGHADEHAMAWDPKVPGRVYKGNDGGIWRSDDNGEKWVRFRSLPISQIYTLDVGQVDVASTTENELDRMVVGLQDNGGQRSWGQAKPGAPANERWHDYTNGDGQRVLIAPDRPQVLYGCYQYGECVVSTNGGSSTSSFTLEVVSSRKNWTTPIEFDPRSSRTVYTGGEIMSRSTDDGSTWSIVSPDLTNGPGRETNPLFRNYGTIQTISPAVDGKTVYAGTDDGNVWYTRDIGSIANWKKAADPDLPKAWVTRVEADPRDATGKTAYVSFSGFRMADDAPYVLRTTDGGVNWTDISGNLPKAPVNDVKVVKDTLVAATDVGVFLLRNGERTWLRLGTGLPMAPAYEVQYQTATDTLFVATFGRSAYKVSAAVLG